MSPDADARALPTSPRPAPVTLRVALGVVLLEAVAFCVLAVAELFSLSTDRLSMGLTTALFFLGYGLALVLCARGMWRRETWGRSIVVMGQLLQLGVAWSYRDATPGLSGLLAVSALVVLVGLFVPASLAWFEEDDEQTEA